MKRFTAGLVAGLLTVSGIAYAVTGAQPPQDAHCVEVQELGVWVCGTTSTSTSTTSSTSSTTTTSTTLPPTTTVPETTTTVQGALVIPPTQHQTIPGFQDNESFTIMTACLANRDGTPNECGTQTQQIGEFDYIGHGMPYLYSENTPGQHRHAWWVAGDREHYACAYGFMYDVHPNPFGNTFDPPRPAHFIARFSIVRPMGQAYGGVNDRFMDEAERYYDGTPFEGATQEITTEDCQTEALEPGFDYENYQPHGADAVRVGLFRADGEIADIRDFTEVEVGMPGHFEFISLENGRAQIVFVLESTQQVSHVFYYDTLGDGRIAVEVNGQTIQDNA